MMQHLGSVRLIPARAALVLDVPPAERHTFAPCHSEIVPAVRAFVKEVALAPPGRAAADIVAAVVRRIGGAGSLADALGPAGAAVGGGAIGIVRVGGVDQLGL